MPSAHKKTTSTAAVLSTLAIGLGANAQFDIDPAAAFLAGSQPSGLATGDFDGDGDIDLATTVDGPDRMIVLLNNGAGSYSLGPSVLLGASSSPQDIIAGDLDGDGDVDAAVAVRDPAGAVVTIFNNGGSFSIGPSAPVGDRPRGLSIADMDGDGDLDVAVANRDSDDISILRNGGGGSFTVMTLAAGAEPRATTFLDIDGDGDLDVASTAHDDRQVRLFTNNGASFSPSGTLSVGGLVRPDGLSSADLDNDGDHDIAVAVSDQTLGINQVMIFTNTGGSFSGPVGFDTGGSDTSDVVAADFDCDGLMDLLASNQDSNNVSFLRNTGGASFGAAQVMAAGTRPGDLVAADLDGDGDADAAVANRDSNNVSVYINQTCEKAPSIPGDVDGDGDVDFTDLLALLSAWGPCPAPPADCPADFDGSGSVNFTDLLTLLSNWTS